MNVLSLFDGISCGQIALNKAGIKYDNYYASEINSHAIKVTMHNYPNSIQMGNVTELTADKLPKIDLLMGGSPCTNFSFSGTGKGMVTKCGEEILTLDRYLELKSEGFQFEGQSYLFWEYIRLLSETKPKYFLLENVIMHKKWEAIITQTLGIEPIMINSALVSAQTRKRLYWTNIPNITIPEDRGITWSDVKEQEFNHGIFSNDLQSVAAMRGRYIVDGKRTDGKMKTAGLTTQYIEFRYDGKTNWLTTVAKDNIVVPYTLPNRVPASEFQYRNITPTEYEKLQTVPVGYTSVISDSQRCKCLGNGWTVDVIAHILGNIK